MNSTPASVPQLSLKDQCFLLGHELRIGILRELCKGQPLPVGELARRVGCTGNAMSKQMALIAETRVVQQIYGRLYVMTPQYLPPPGATTLDLGQLLLKLAPPA